MFRKFSILIGLLVTSLTQTACSGQSQEATQLRDIPWWIWLLIVLVLVALWLWWSLRRPKERAVPTAKPKAAAPPHAVEAPEDVPERTPPVPEVPKPDDLRRIEGIGPKISSLLQAAGIMTFAQLAATDVSRLKEIIAEAGLTALADPTTWPEQASLAAAGQWDALKTLQEELRGGRRV
jgi:predicted flap endonuclease-1-like 5' DNA nuclease